MAKSRLARLASDRALSADAIAHARGYVDGVMAGASGRIVGNTGLRVVWQPVPVHVSQVPRLRAYAGGLNLEAIRAGLVPGPEVFHYGDDDGTVAEDPCYDMAWDRVSPLLSSLLEKAPWRRHCGGRLPQPPVFPRPSAFLRLLVRQHLAVASLCSSLATRGSAVLVAGFHFFAHRWSSAVTVLRGGLRRCSVALGALRLHSAGGDELRHVLVAGIHYFAHHGSSAVTMLSGGITRCPAALDELQFVLHDLFEAALDARLLAAVVIAAGALASVFVYLQCIVEAANGAGW